MPSSGSRVTLSLCALAALSEGFDTQSMGVAAPHLVAEFALSTSQSTLIFSSTTLGLFVGAAVGGRLADLLGRKRTLVVSLLLFGIFSITTALMTGPLSFMAVRLLTGLGLGGAMPNFIALASESTSEARRVSIVTLIMAAMPFGGAIAALVALGAQAGWGWRTIFYVGGIFPVLLSGLMAAFLPETRRPVPHAAEVQGPASVGSALFGGQRAATTLLLWVGFFFTQLVLLLMLNWLPTLMVGLGYTRSQASWAAVCFNLGGSLGAGFLGRLHAGARRAPWVATTYGAIALALTAVSAVGKSYAFAAVACAVAGVFIIGAQLILFALAPLYYPRSIRGTGVGVSVSMGRLGSVVGPLFAGALLAGGGGSATVLLGILPFVVIGGAAAFALAFRSPCIE